MNNIILITSVINTPNKPLSYSKTRSVYNRRERFGGSKLRFINVNYLQEDSLNAQTSL